MVALPRYVRPVRKPNGRTYHYFEKHRQTAQAWPRVRIPADPLTPEFAKRIEQCERLVATAAKEGWGWAFVDATNRQRDLPAPDDCEAFWAAVDKAEKIGLQLAAGERKTFSALITEYRDSPAYLEKIAESTRAGYDQFIDVIEEIWGNDPVASLTPVEAQKAIDSYRDTPASGRYFRSVLSRVIKWGIPRGYRDDNPILLTEKIEAGGTYEPWPPWAFELFFEHARVDLHLPVYSGLFTGQRKVDVLKMLRPKAQAMEMPIVAQKTSDLVPVQIHSEYRAIISAAKADHVMLHLRSDGEPWLYEGFKTAWERQMKRTEFARFREHRLVFHGLRKNAVCMLLEVGCSEARVGAIVGMSQAMVEHYSRKVSKFRLARGAMKQLEEGWAEMRQSVLGSVKRLG